MREKYFTAYFLKMYSDKPKEASHTSQKSRNLSIESNTWLYRLLIPKPTTTRRRVKLPSKVIHDKTETIDSLQILSYAQQISDGMRSVFKFLSKYLSKFV